MNNFNKLKVAFWNKGGHWASKLLKKLNEITNIIKSNNLDLMIIGEANLKLNDLNKMKIPGYEIKLQVDINNRLVIIHKNHLVIKNVVYYRN